MTVNPSNSLIHNENNKDNHNNNNYMLLPLVTPH